MLTNVCYFDIKTVSVNGYYMVLIIFFPLLFGTFSDQINSMRPFKVTIS